MGRQGFVNLKVDLIAFFGIACKSKFIRRLEGTAFGKVIGSRNIRNGRKSTIDNFEEPFGMIHVLPSACYYYFHGHLSHFHVQ